MTGVRGARLSGLVPTGQQCPQHGMQPSGNLRRACGEGEGCTAGVATCPRAEDGALLMLRWHVWLWAGGGGGGGRGDHWGTGGKGKSGYEQEGTGCVQCRPALHACGSFGERGDSRGVARWRAATFTAWSDGALRALCKQGPRGGCMWRLAAADERARCVLPLRPSVPGCKYS